MLADGGFTSRKSFALVLLCAASFLGVVDTTIVSIALPSIARELGFSAGDAQWVLNGYALVFGGLLLLLGRAADLYGRRRVFTIGLALFGVSSLVGGLAWAPWVLISARCFQGAGGAALVVAALSLVTATFPEGQERNRALGVYGAMAALGFVAGMILGGVLTEFLGWRWVMFVNVPVAFLALLLAPVAVSESRDEESSRVLDISGAVLATLGLAALIYAISEVPQNGWVSLQTLGFVGIGVLLVGGFVAVESRSPAPLVPLEMFRERAVAIPNAALMLQSMIGISWLFVLTFYFQDALGHGPLETGLFFAPMTVASVVASPVAGRLVTQFGVKPTVVAGLALVAAGLLLMARMSGEGGLYLVLSGMVIGEAGFMLSNVSLTISATGGAGEDRRGLAAGVMNTSIQLGNAFGLGVISTVVAAATAILSGTQAGTEALIGGLRWGLLSCIGIAILALLVVFVGLRGREISRRKGGRS